MPKITKEGKAEIIDNLQELLSKCSIGILTDYRGLSAPEINDLRRRLKESGIDYRVVKNTLARFAAERAGREELISLFEGPVAIAFGYGDIAEPAKLLTDYINTSKETLAIKGGFVGSRLLTLDDIKLLSTLPPREVLLGKILGGMQAPIVGLITCLAAPIRGIIGVLQARIQQLEGE